MFHMASSSTQSGDDGGLTTGATFVKQYTSTLASETIASDSLSILNSILSKTSDII